MRVLGIAFIVLWVLAPAGTAAGSAVAVVDSAATSGYGSSCHGLVDAGCWATHGRYCDYYLGAASAVGPTVLVFYTINGLSGNQFVCMESPCLTADIGIIGQTIGVMRNTCLPLEEIPGFEAVRTGA